MNRILIPAVAAAAVLLAFWRPATPAAGISMNASPPAAAQHLRKGHPSRSAAPSKAVVYVAGAVVHAGLYTLASGARAQEAVARAGGLRADADAAGVNLAQRVTDGEEIDVPRQGETPPRVARRTRAARKSAAVPAAVDLNGADAPALASLPGIGPTLAARIVEYRRLNGPFASIDELADVAGMTQRRVDALLPYLVLHDAP
jgi:competence protein ComEA